MMQQLGGRFNPQDGFEDDICMYILGAIPYGGEPAASYFDVVDCGFARLSRVRGMTKGPVISVSEIQYKYFLDYFPKRKVHLIPHHHCNYHRETIPDRPVRRVGTIGGDSAIQWPHFAMDRMLKEIGVEWSYVNIYSRREQVVEYYKQLDVQIAWRPTHARGLVIHMNTIKLANAGSFGIPTVAFPEPAWTTEWGKDFVWVDTMYGLMKEVKRLKDDRAWYQEMSNRAKIRAEGYHIDRIAGLYRALPEAA
jgi:hypothetical protein